MTLNILIGLGLIKNNSWILKYLYNLYANFLLIKIYFIIPVLINPLIVYLFELVYNNIQFFIKGSGIKELLKIALKNKIASYLFLLAT